MGDDLIPLAMKGGFTLFERKGRSTPEWLNLKLIRKTKKRVRKKNWWLGWNGERLALGHDAKILAEHYPHIEQWVIERLRDRTPSACAERPAAAAPSIRDMMKRRWRVEIAGRVNAHV